MGPLVKALKWTLIIVGSIVLLFFIYIEAFLISGDETGVGDIISVTRVNFGADYVVLSTSGSGKDTVQNVMFKSYDKMKKLLSKHGCVQTYKNNNFFYNYTSKDGKEFTVITKTDIPGNIYITYQFEGITIEEITGKK